MSDLSSPLGASQDAVERLKKISELPMQVVSAKTPFFSGEAAVVREVWGRRELVGLLVRRELRARYKGSSLGVVWSLVKPLVQLLVYYLAIGQILGASRLIPSFAIFVFIGLTAWTLSTEIINSGTRSIIDNAGLVRKVSVPAEVFPLAGIGGALVNLAIQLLVLLAVMLAVGEFPYSWRILWVLPSLTLIVVFSSAVAFLLAALNVYFRDIQHLVEVVLIVAFWVSPIVYSYQFVSTLPIGAWLQVYLLNPITLAVLGMQQGLWVAGRDLPESAPQNLDWMILIAIAISSVLLWLSLRVFRRLQGNFAQEL